jgi:NTP pyrophosphatase (non-canonical NTP hydrolase)
MLSLKEKYLYETSPFVENCMIPKLIENDYKGSWKNYGTSEWWKSKLKEETAELHNIINICINRFHSQGDVEKLKSELGDVANICMMIYDNIEYLFGD